MKLYTTIIELPYFNFIKASVTGDLNKYLTIEGEATEEELNNAWHEIQSQYAEAIGDNEQKLVLKLVKEISTAETKYNKVVLLVNVLRTRYVEPFAKMLNKTLVTSFKFDITQIDQYDKNLDRCLTRAKSFKIEYERKTLELQALLEKRGTSNQKPEEEYYYKLWNSVKLYHGLKDSVKDITTFDFCDFLQRMLKEAEKGGKK